MRHSVLFKPAHLSGVIISYSITYSYTSYASGFILVGLYVGLGVLSLVGLGVLDFGDIVGINVDGFFVGKPEGFFVGVNVVGTEVVGALLDPLNVDGFPVGECDGLK